MQSKKQERIAVSFLGLPGAGKDEQAARLKEYLEMRDGAGSVLYSYTGQILRDAMKAGTYTGKLIDNKVMKVGAKAPDFLAICAWGGNFISELKDNNHIILSSSPRTLLEAKILDTTFPFYDITHVYPIYLKTTEEEAFERLKKRARPGETDDIIKERMGWFMTEVRPAIEYYRTESKNKLIEIDGSSHDREKIHADIKKAIGI